jgi:hypothetical protein
MNRLCLAREALLKKKSNEKMRLKKLKSHLLSLRSTSPGAMVHMHMWQHPSGYCAHIAAIKQ